MPVWLVALALFSSLGLAADAHQTTPSPADTCADWQDCQQRTLQAIDAGEFETAHDLAWRTVQAGPPKQPDLMYLLARAQSLSGRAGDALVMLRRLAEMGAAVDAATNPDLTRTRNLPGWPDVETLLAGVIARPDASSEAADAAPPAAVVSPTRAERTRAKPSKAATEAAAPPAAPAASDSTATIAIEEAMRFSADRFVARGLAYDTVSRRFLFGDRDGRKLRVVGEGLDHAVDLVRSPNAGFLDVLAVEIDARRGDLWVASAEPDGTGSALHKLQLVSGRHLETFSMTSDDGPTEPVDLAVTAGGTVLAIDARGGRLLRLRPGANAVETVMTIKGEHPQSLSIGRAEEVAYVAHAGGLARIDLQARTATVVRAPKGVDVGRFERIRLHRRALVGVQVGQDGQRRIVRLELNANGRAIRSAKVYNAPIGSFAGPLSVTIVGDDLCFVSADLGAPEASGGAASEVELVVRRIPLG